MQVIISNLNKCHMKKNLLYFIFPLYFFCNDSFAFGGVFNRIDTSSFSLVINSISISGNKIPIRRWSTKDPLSLTPTYNNISIQFAKNNFSTFPFGRCLYKLEGWDKEWNEIEVNESG